MGGGDKIYHDLVHVDASTATTTKSVYWKRKPDVVRETVTTLTLAHSEFFKSPCCGSGGIEDLEDSDEELYDVGCADAAEDIAAFDEVLDHFDSSDTGSTSSADAPLAKDRGSGGWVTSQVKDTKRSSTHLIRQVEVIDEDEEVPFALGEKFLARAFAGDMARGRMAPKDVQGLRNFVTNMMPDDYQGLFDRLFKQAQPDVGHPVGSMLGEEEWLCRGFVVCLFVFFFLFSILCLSYVSLSLSLSLSCCATVGFHATHEIW
jgi:hypothetical protein